jgi:hypothetical protein
MRLGVAHLLTIFLLHEVESSHHRTGIEQCHENTGVIILDSKANEISRDVVIISLSAS